MSEAGDDDAMTVTSSASTENKLPPRWEKQHCEILARWAEIAASYQWLHLRAFLAVSKTNRNFSIPIIVLSTLCGSASLSTSSLPVEYQALAPSVIGLVSLSTGILGTISEFLRVSEREAGHRVASLGFGSLARGIRAELSMPVIDRSMHGAEFIHKCKENLDQLHADSPVVPMAIVKQFARKFKKDETFAKPDLFSISPCNVFDDIAAQVAAQANVEQEVVDEAAARAAREAAQNAARMAVREERAQAHARDVAASNVGQDLDRLVENMVGARRRAEQVSIQIEDDLREDGDAEEESVHSSEERELAQLHRDRGAGGAAPAAAPSAAQE